MTGNKYRPYLVVDSCPTCGKHGYATRRDARRAARISHPNDRMSAYPCGRLWHYGHLAPSVIRGKVSRDVMRK